MNPASSGAPVDTDHDDEVRLVLTSDRAGDSVLDGAWWPRSRNPLIEIPLLVTALHPWIGDVAQLSMSGAGWSRTPRAVPVDQQRITICWFSPVDLHEAVVTAANDVEVALLVVPPSAAPISAQAAMAAAARGTSMSRGSQILATHGVSLRAGAERNRSC